MYVNVCVGGGGLHTYVLLGKSVYLCECTCVYEYEQEVCVG